MALTATPIPCLSDNYAWLLRAANGRLAVCDPADHALLVDELPTDAHDVRMHAIATEQGIVLPR